MIFLLLLVFISDQFFDLGSWWYRSGVFNITDVGNALIWVGVLFAFSFSIDRKNFWNPIALLIVFYILFVFFTIILAHFNYGQPFFDGLVAIRHQFYFLTFFLYIVILKDTDRLYRFLNLLIGLSFVLVILGIINYFGPTIFSHKWAEGHGIRAGILRAYIPGMSVISLATIWAFTKWLESNKGWERKRSLLSTVFLLGALLFRQTRMRVISIAVVVWAALLIRRKWKPLAVFFLVSMAAFAVMNTAMEKNVLTQAFSTAVTDVLDNTGTYPGRYVQMMEDFKEFKRHPWAGSGAGAVRAPSEIGGSRLQYRMALLTAKSDLGYSSWLSSYGLLGVAWLSLFFYVQFSMVLKALKRTTGNDNTLAHFGLSYLIYELVSFITVPHLLHTDSIIMDTLVAAVIVRLYYKTRNVTAPEDDAGQPARHGELESAVGLS